MPDEQSLAALIFATLIIVAGFARGILWMIQRSREGGSDQAGGLGPIADDGWQKSEPGGQSSEGNVPGNFHWLDLALYLSVCLLTLMTVGPLLPLISVLLGWWILERRGVAALDLWGFRLREWGWYAWRGADLYLLIIIPLSICAALSLSIATLMGIEVAPQPLIQDFLEMEDGSQILQLIVLAVVVAPLWEELVFRGILYPICRGLRDPVFGMLSTAVLFGLVHGHGPSFFPLTFLGFILAYVFEKTGKLGLCIGLHAAFNASTTITLLLIKYGG